MPANLSVKALAETGKQYAVHIMGGKNIQLTVTLPAGKYNVTWINTLTGLTMLSKMITATINPATIISPAYNTDIALKIIRRD